MRMYELIKYTFWGTGKPSADSTVYEEMIEQGIAVLPASVIKSLDLQPELKQKWQTYIIQQIAYFTRQQYVQAHLPLSVPYVILKGTTAAQYYPHPEFRTMGDIDIMPIREMFIKACDELIAAGWIETTNHDERYRGRHRSFFKNGLSIEVHAFFASMNDPVKARRLDDYIINNITETHILPDIINGLVLIDHINQHLEEGIGLRHIIDWMMYVDKCLNDKQWLRFEPLVTSVGLKTLSITVTRMCEMYLGCPVHNWSSKADDRLCKKLMNYIITSGNFGNKIDPSDTIAISRIIRMKHPFRSIKRLHEKGQAEHANTKVPFLKCFAWVSVGKKILKGTPDFLKLCKKAKERNAMFDALGVKRFADGLVYYENGRYVKKKTNK